MRYRCTVRWWILAVLLGLHSGVMASPNIIVILADDMGYADLGIVGQRADVKTPHLDQLARDGVWCTSGYVTAPQCAPSRAGLLTGRYQQRYDFDDCAHGPLPLSEKTLATRLTAHGYHTGMIGKWHLEPNWLCNSWLKAEMGIKSRSRDTRVPFDMLRPYFPHARGFDDFFKGEMNRYFMTWDLDGQDLNPVGEWDNLPGLRVDIKTQAALSFIDRNKDRPFFLYLAYFAPHLPLEATEEYLSRFPEDMPERRRYALAMHAAMDDGVGAIRDRLRSLGIERNTLIFFTSDNGAPLDEQQDVPVDDRGSIWNGSLNTPWNGEKAMLLEGGIRVPLVMAWPGTIRPGRVCKAPISTLDFVPTSLSAADVPIPENLDGVNLMPYLTGEADAVPDRTLYWRFWGQSAVQRGHWKFVRLDDGRQMLYDLSGNKPDMDSVIAQYPEKAAELLAVLKAWAAELTPAGLRSGPMPRAEERVLYPRYVDFE